MIRETVDDLQYVVSTSHAEPITEIMGGPDLFINKGSTINLTCLVRYAPEPPPAMVWSHNQQVINFDSPRGGVSLVTEKGPTTTSRLLIQKAAQADIGTYTCSPSNANPANVRVHILNGKCVRLITLFLMNQYVPWTCGAPGSFCIQQCLLYSLQFKFFYTHGIFYPSV